MEGVDYRVPWRSRDPVLKQGIVSLRLFCLGVVGFWLLLLVCLCALCFCGVFLEIDSSCAHKRSEYWKNSGISIWISTTISIFKIRYGVRFKKKKSSETRHRSSLAEA